MFFGLSCYALEQVLGFVAGNRKSAITLNVLWMIHDHTVTDDGAVSLTHHTLMMLRSLIYGFLPPPLPPLLSL